MANQYLKPQIPLKDLNSEDYFYPLTTLDQVQKTDGSRVQEYELGNVVAEEGEEIISNPETSEISALMNAIYPIGSIYMSVNATSPAILFGGTWEALDGKFLIGANGTYAAGSTGGSTTHTHNVTAAGINAGTAITIPQLPGAVVVRISDGAGSALTGGGTVASGTWADAAIRDRTASGQNANGQTHTHTFTGSAVTSSATSTLPPYLAVYMWKRIN